MTDATIGWGTKSYMQDAGGTYVQLAEVIDFPYPEDQVARIEATHMLSPGRRKEYITGLIDGGSGDLVTNYVPGSPTHVLLRDALAAGTSRGFRIQELQADGTYYESDVAVIVTGYKRTAPIDNRKTATATLTFTGAATETDI